MDDLITFQDHMFKLDEKAFVVYLGELQKKSFENFDGMKSISQRQYEEIGTLVDTLNNMNQFINGMSKQGLKPVPTTASKNIQCESVDKKSLLQKKSSSQVVKKKKTEKLKDSIHDESENVRLQTDG